jgi:phosphoadenosine phosphosulfate reductase
MTVSKSVLFDAPGHEPRDAALGSARPALVAKRLEGAHPNEILKWAVETLDESLTLSVSFGNAEGMVLLDMLSRITDKVRVFTLDTGFLFEETVRFREKVMRKYPLPLKVLTPELSVEEQVERYGPELYSCKPEICCQVRKIGPQRRFLMDYGAWITGIRRDQTAQRRNTPIVAYDEFFRVAKIAPLAAWSAEDVHEYVKRYEVPLNPLLSMGYRSIGCEPCTRPVAPGEGERAGRWPGLEKTECGLHITGGKVHRATL